MPVVSLGCLQCQDYFWELVLCSSPKAYYRRKMAKPTHSQTSTCPWESFPVSTNFRILFPEFYLVTILSLLSRHPFSPVPSPLNILVSTFSLPNTSFSVLFPYTSLSSFSFALRLRYSPLHSCFRGNSSIFVFSGIKKLENKKSWANFWFLKCFRQSEKRKGEQDFCLRI